MRSANITVSQEEWDAMDELEAIQAATAAEMKDFWEAVRDMNWLANTGSGSSNAAASVLVYANDKNSTIYGLHKFDSGRFGNALLIIKMSKSLDRGELAGLSKLDIGRLREIAQQAPEAAVCERHHRRTQGQACETTR